MHIRKVNLHARLPLIQFNTSIIDYNKIYAKSNVYSKHVELFNPYSYTVYAYFFPQESDELIEFILEPYWLMKLNPYQKQNVILKLRILQSTAHKYDLNREMKIITIPDSVHYYMAIRQFKDDIYRKYTNQYIPTSEMQTIQVKANVMPATLTIEPLEVRLTNAIANTPQEINYKIYNPTFCDIYYEVTIVNKELGLSLYFEEPSIGKESQFTTIYSHGVIRASETITNSIWAYPTNCFDSHDNTVLHPICL